MAAVTLRELQDTSQPGLADPYTTEKWRILSFPSIGGVSLSSAACEEIEIPFPVFQVKSKEIASTSIHFPQGSSVEGFPAMFGIDQKAAVLRYFQSWSGLIQNPYTGGFRLPSVYKKNLQIALYDVKGNVIVTSEVRNCWPLGLQSLSLNGQGGRGMISVQFQCDAQRLIFQ